jgi:hypothetical protein
MPNLAIGLDLFGASGTAAPAPPALSLTNRLWLRADLAVTGTSTVDKWADSGPKDDANKDCIGNGATRPALTASWTNGRPAITFTVAQKLRSGTWAAAITQPFTVYLVGRSNSAIASVYAFDDLTDPPQTAIYDGIASPAMYAGAGPLNGSGNLEVPCGVICVFNGASSKFYLSQATPASGNAGTNVFSGTSIGNYAAGGTFAGWDIAEVAVYSGAPTSGDITTLNNNTHARYGITIGA